VNNNGFFGEMLEKGQQAVGKTAKNVVSDVAGSVAGQLGVKQGESSPDSQGQSQNQSANQSQPQAPETQATDAEATKNFVKEFYAPSTNIPENLTPEERAKMQQSAQVETQQKLANLRQELHRGVYYDPLVAYENKSEQEEDEDSAAKRVEKQEREEDQKKMELEEKKAKDDQDIAKTRAQTKVESNRGAAG
jgi:hypothetical protein